VVKRVAGDCRQVFIRASAKDPVLRPYFPGKTLRCAIESFAAFLIQFLHGDEKQTQHRWHLSLRESHARFQIGSDARRAWLKNMEGTLHAAPLDEKREMRFATFSLTVRPISLARMLASRIMKSWLRVGASSGLWMMSPQQSSKGETMRPSFSQHALHPVHLCSWDCWYGWFSPVARG
jgi:truncated hemoglobin YjbI